MSDQAIFSTRAAIIACLIAGITNIPFNVMPMILGVAADSFGMSASQIGLLGGATLAGWVAGTALSFLVMRKVDWRVCALVGTAITVLALLASLELRGAEVLYACWFIVGLGAAIPTCVSFEILGNSGHQERYFGIMVLGSVLISALILWLFPAFILPIWSYNGLAAGFAAIFVIVAPLALILPTRLDNDNSRDVRDITLPSPPPAARWALLAFLIFFSGQSATWAFLERAGREIDLSHENIGAILAGLKVVGGIAAAAPIIIAERLGHRWPFIASLIGTVLGCAVLYVSDDATSYIVGSWVWEFFFTVMFCYTTAAVSRIDSSGRIVALVPGAIGLGGAIGPTVAGYLKTGPGFLSIYTFNCLCMFACMCIMLALFRRRAATPATSQPFERTA
jgi:predicted MFS family arabinose efflux permease